MYLLTYIHTMYVLDEGIRVRTFSNLGQGELVRVKPLDTKNELVCELVTSTGIIKVDDKTDPKLFLPEVLKTVPIQRPGQVVNVPNEGNQRGLQFSCENYPCVGMLAIP